MDRLIRFKELRTIVPFCRSKIYQDMDNGTFPKPLKLGRSVAWRERDIREWLQQQEAKQEARQTPLPVPPAPTAPPPSPKKPKAASAAPPKPAWRTLERRA